ncbi:NITROGEN METABOLIC REGULATION PROTEIN NMR-RELATED [Ceraceosorus bombacis]|uniref:NITROGEN METABOLIC REGULATION PROTEIN NMR-RELATED n=1 Tax=Ceraceosorus bombacis TaxID=401625 RepID=A0A0P1BA41_9BASI|nr:NITROGEN METABOLIC REGULATION PROTEIN NMR-RELATED [Ceraceosorus bombacis]
MHFARHPSLHHKPTACRTAGSPTPRRSRERDAARSDDETPSPITSPWEASSSLAHIMATSSAASYFDPRTPDRLINAAALSSRGFEDGAHQDEASPTLSRCAKINDSPILSLDADDGDAPSPSQSDDRCRVVGRKVVIFGATSARGFAAVSGLLDDNEAYKKKRIENAYQATRRKAMLADHGLTEEDAHLLPAMLPLSPSVLDLRAAARPGAYAEAELDQQEAPSRPDEDFQESALSVKAPALSASQSSTLSTRRFRSDGFEAVDEEEARPMLLNPYAAAPSLPLDLRNSTSPTHGPLCGAHRNSISDPSVSSGHLDTFDKNCRRCDDRGTIGPTSTQAQSGALLVDDRFSAELISAMHTRLSRSGASIDLSPRWHIVAVTRSLNGRAANELRELGVEVVEADLQKPESIAAVLKAAYACFIPPYCLWGWPLAPRMLDALDMPGGLIDQLCTAECSVEVVIYDAIETIRAECSQPPASILKSNAIDVKLRQANAAGHLKCVTTLDNVVPFDLALEGETAQIIVPISRDGGFWLDVLAPTDLTLPFCCIGDLNSIVPLILNSPHEKFNQRHVDLCSDVLTPRELTQQLCQALYISCVKVHAKEHTTQDFYEMLKAGGDRREACELINYFMDAPRSRRPRREPSNSSTGYHLSTWFDWSSPRLKEILPEYEFLDHKTRPGMGTSQGDHIFYQQPFFAAQEHVDFDLMLSDKNSHADAQGSASTPEAEEPKWASKIAW